MKILFLTTHLNAGGITSYLLILTRGLIRNGHDVCLVSSGGTVQETFAQEGATILNMDLKTKTFLSLKLLLAEPLLREFVVKHDIDIIHAHTRVTQVLAHRVSRRIKIPYVTTCHGFFKPKISRRIFPCWGDRVVAISPAVSEHLKKDFKVDDKKIALVQSGVDIAPFLSVVPRAHKEPDNDQRVYWIGEIARLSDVKGQDVLIRAMSDVVKHVPNVRLVLAGEGRLAPLLRKLVEEYDLENVVQFFPTFNRTADILRMLDIFVMPSRKEGLGLSILEAQAAALPVVASQTGGIVSLIDDGKTGFLVEPGNPKRLAKVLVDVLKSPDKGRAVGFAARKFVSEARFLENMISGVENVYRQVVK